MCTRVCSTNTCVQKYKYTVDKENRTHNNGNNSDNNKICNLYLITISTCYVGTLVIVPLVCTDRSFSLS